MEEPTGDLIDAPAYRWPTKGDRLLVASANWATGVEFPQAEEMRHVYIWTGYMRAAETLIDATVNTHRHDRETLLYPILFNYRHAIELAMKWVVTHYRGLSDVTTQELDEANHDLWKLWLLCRRIIDASSTEEQEEGTAAAEQLIKDLHDLDGSSMALRYGRKKGGGSFKLPEGRVDLNNTRDVMQGLSNFFDGLDGYLDAVWSAGQ